MRRNPHPGLLWLDNQGDTAVLTDRYKLALQFAADVHEGQTKKGSGVAYLSHLLSVSALVIENDGDLRRLRRASDELVAELRRRAAQGRTPA